MTAIAILLMGFGVVWGCEEYRLQEATASADALAAQQSTFDAQRTDVASTMRDLQQLENVQIAVASWRRAGLDRHDTLEGIAKILARSPLSMMKLADNGASWTITGAAKSEADVGRAVVALRKAPHVAHVQFLSTTRGAVNTAFGGAAKSGHVAVAFSLDLLKDAVAPTVGVGSAGTVPGGMVPGAPSVPAVSPAPVASAAPFPAQSPAATGKGGST